MNVNQKELLVISVGIMLTIVGWLLFDIQVIRSGTNSRVQIPAPGDPPPPINIEVIEKLEAKQ